MIGGKSHQTTSTINTHHAQPSKSHSIEITASESTRIKKEDKQQSYHLQTYHYLQELNTKSKSF